MINFIGFNVAWFGLVYWGNIFIPIALIMLAAHLYFLSEVRGEFLLIITITIIGLLVDSLLQYFTVFDFGDINHIPYWLVMLWACFAATLCHNLHFLARSEVLQALAGGAISPLSYLAGYKLGAVGFGLPVSVTYVLLALIWAILFMLFFALKEYVFCKEFSKEQRNKLIRNNLGNSVKLGIKNKIGPNEKALKNNSIDTDKKGEADHD